MNIIVLGLTAAAALTVAATPASAGVNFNGFVANGVTLNGANENGIAGRVTGVTSIRAAIN